jgi:hypothetical protein
MPQLFSLQRAGYLLSDKKISINAMLHFNVIVRRVMALSLERIIWYDFNSFLHLEIFVEELFFSTKKLLDERWEVVPPPPPPLLPPRMLSLPRMRMLSLLRTLPLPRTLPLTVWLTSILEFTRQGASIPCHEGSAAARRGRQEGSGRHAARKAAAAARQGRQRWSRSKEGSGGRAAREAAAAA